MDKLKIVGIAGTLVLAVNIVLFALGIITPLLFWIIIAVMAAFVYVLLPKLRKK